MIMDQEMSEPASAQRTMVAPSRLTAEYRLDFRRAVLEALEQSVRDGGGLVELDLRGTIEIDASGLGVLILLQKRARERGIVVRLHNVPGTVEQLLDATRLGPLFDIVRL